MGTQGHIQKMLHQSLNWEICKKIAKLMMENKPMDDGRIEEVPTYPTTRSSLILDEHDKRTLKNGITTIS